MKKLFLFLTLLAGMAARAHGQCQAEFNWEQIPNTLTVHFNSTSTSEHGIVSYQWFFGDGQQGDGQNPNHTYAEAGTYNVCLVITDEVGCIDETCHMVTVAPVSNNCQANFSWEQIPNTLTVHFNNTSTSEHDIVSYQWFFGDGQQGDGQNPNHTYAEAGTYNVCLVITDAVGCIDETCHMVTVAPVNNSCEADFTWEQLPNTLNIHFHSTSTSNHDIISYQWNFGDGHMGDGPNPYHLYEEPGTYVVCLVITDNAGCVSDVCHEVVVAPLNTCHAQFIWEQYAGTLEVDFQSTSTSNHDIVSYQWNFGDGNTGDGPNPSHTYDEPGVYLVCLIITDSEGCMSDVCHEVVVEGPGECNADFNWEQLPNTLNIHFHSTSTSNHDIVSYWWDFGDGHNGDGQNPYHLYEDPGVYVVCLTITDNSGCVDETCHEVVVEGVTNECHAEFTWEQLPGTLTLHFHSTSTSNHDIISYQWNFGDGHMGDGSNPYHTYEEPGTYLVCLIITDNAGCVSDVCHEVVVEPATGECHAEFTWEQIPGTTNIRFNSTSTSNHDIVSYLWSFGDGQTGDGHNPLHHYAEPGVYVVCLTITDNSGCVDEICHEVVVAPVTNECNAAFTWEQIPGTTNIQFNSTSTSNHDIVSYLWNFGDGHTGDGHHPLHHYAEPGVYLVCLTITDNAGCVDDVCHEVVVLPVTNECHAAFNWEQLPGTLTIHFHSTSTSNHDIISYLWTFGDGHTSDGMNPYHTYEEPGVYVVCLTITDNAGCVDDVCHEVHVEAPANECHAEFTWEQIDTLTLGFTSTSTSNHDIISYQWNFGDGHMGDGPNPHHTYEDGGVYLVCLIITDNAGCVSDVCHEVAVTSPAYGESQFGYSIDPGGHLVSFYNQSQGANEQTAWTWTFGDGGSSEAHSPTHYYQQSGLYNVCLTMWDPSNGFTDTYCARILVGSPELDSNPDRKPKDAGNPDRPLDTGNGLIGGITVTNPASEQITVRFALEGESNVTIDLHDLSGGRIARHDLGIRASGDHVHGLAVHDLAPGLYAVRILAGQAMIVRTVIVTR